MTAAKKAKDPVEKAQPLTLEERVEALEEKRSSVDEKQRADIQSLRKRVDDAEETLKSVNADTVRRRLDSMAENMRHLDRRQQVMILRATVAGELTHFAPHLGNQEQAASISKIIISAFDNSDDWWLERRSFTIHQWFRALIEWASAGAVVVTDAKGAA